MYLNVWYEGAAIEVGKTYNPNDIVIYLFYSDGKRERLSHKDCSISSYLVEKEGWNWYIVTYTRGTKKITQEFPVFGIVYKNYIDLSFKVLYIDDVTKEESNLTKDFETALSFDGILSLSWNTFLSRVNELQNYGLYIVTVPKLCGLSNRYDMDWEVLCINETTIKATIKKIYNEEETENGED